MDENMIVRKGKNDQDLDHLFLGSMVHARHNASELDIAIAVNAKFFPK